MRIQFWLQCPPKLLPGIEFWWNRSPSRKETNAGNRPWADKSCVSDHPINTFHDILKKRSETEHWTDMKHNWMILESSDLGAPLRHRGPFKGPETMHVPQTGGKPVNSVLWSRKTKAVWCMGIKCCKDKQWHLSNHILNLWLPNQNNTHTHKRCLGTWSRQLLVAPLRFLDGT